MLIAAEGSLIGLDCSKDSIQFGFMFLCELLEKAGIVNKDKYLLFFLFKFCREQCESEIVGKYNLHFINSERGPFSYAD